MLKRYTIYGERCSGTNYLENLININFNVNITWEYGWKHFFGFEDEKLKNSDDTLFICIVRNLPDWINSFYRQKYHLPLKYKKNMLEEEKIDEFLNKEFWSFDDNNNNRDMTKEIMTDRNIYTKKRYKNIFEFGQPGLHRAHRHDGQLRSGVRPDPAGRSRYLRGQGIAEVHPPDADDLHGEQGPARGVRQRPVRRASAQGVFRTVHRPDHGAQAALAKLGRRPGQRGAIRQQAVEVHHDKASLAPPTLYLGDR